MLTMLARLALTLHNPTIIAITGSVGKTTTKDMVTAVLQEAGYSVRGSIKSYNSDFGVPLSILGLPSGNRNLFLWFFILIAGVWRAVIGVPKYIVLEVGLELPEEIYDIVRWLHPDVGVLTKLPVHPVHLENFPDRKALYDEKVSLLHAVKQGGSVVYNGEDAMQKPYIRSLPETTVRHAFNGDAVSVVSSGIHYDERHNPIGTDVVLRIRGNEEPMYIPEVLGDGAAQSLAAAIAAVCAARNDIAVPVIRKAIASRAPTPGRMRILRGKNGSTIIDDSYNASPVAVESALRTLAMIDGKKKIAVIGVMAQLGDKSADIHRSVGNKLAAADRVIVVGDADYGEQEHIRYVRTAEAAAEECRALADENTVFLCKGSQVARIEKVVRELLDLSVDPKQTLIRQGAEWE